MRLGVICNSGGSAFNEAIKIIRNSGFEITVTLLTDREAGVIGKCKELKIPYKHIEWKNNSDFSLKAKKLFVDDLNVDLVVVLFTRLLTYDLFSAVKTVNIHPSVLPSFKGFNGLEQSWESSSKFIGCSGHFIDETIDGGDILAQIISSKTLCKNIHEAEKLSFLQKVYIFLVLFEYFSSVIKQEKTLNLNSSLAEPSLLSDKLNKGYEKLLVDNDFERILKQKLKIGEKN